MLSGKYVLTSLTHVESIVINTPGGDYIMGTILKKKMFLMMLTEHIQP